MTATRGAAAQPDDQLVGGERDLEAQRSVAAQPEVDVVPEHGGVAAERRLRAGDDAAVRVALDDLEAGEQGDLVERVGQLADPAGDGRDDAALADLPPGDPQALRAAISSVLAAAGLTTTETTP